ncbi:hypothetical protein SAMN02745163_03190 [Clostridium cavendishii DSM 21758]|uniref:Uncharacterized protein n=1 Tax=Clostridium cavendishii DSM 21758 TaxID=1121302 RepID=A0A1M6PL45_9CLOT|nr:hypothetical protein [Clostridium cavendishii]SHK08702.1 hypothetical protein SAMN02745163_03190 [Clostridium cavendishii DSM 21758]
MEFFYPTNFVRFYSDGNKDEVGEYEVLVDGPFLPIFESLEEYTLNRGYDESYLNYDLDFMELTENSDFRDGEGNKKTQKYLPNALSDFPNNLMQTFPINLAASFIPSGQFGGQGGSPMGPPPAYIPAKNDTKVKSFSPSGDSNNPNMKYVSGGSLKPCLYRYTYIWQNNGRSYWAYLTRIDPRSVSGWRWLGFRWVFFGVDTNRIDSFVCY